MTNYLFNKTKWCLRVSLNIHDSLPNSSDPPMLAMLKICFICPWTYLDITILASYCSLAYLHEAIEPKVVHRDIKSSNILIDDDFNAKVSDFGLAKLLGAGKSHITTRVMGTFGLVYDQSCFYLKSLQHQIIQNNLLYSLYRYVAPEYANTGLLNEKSDVYSFGVVLLESITGRDPVDYGRPSQEVLLKYCTLCCKSV